jgi:hypothetical protein
MNRILDPEHRVSLRAGPGDRGRHKKFPEFLHNKHSPRDRPDRRRGVADICPRAGPQPR